jgi:hypothetical protein
MNRTSENVRGGLVGMTTALLLVSSVVVAACGFGVAAPDFPVLKLTDSTQPETAANTTGAAE